MKTILFIRHGATAGNLERRYIGGSDEPLCELGIKQIKALKAKAFQADYLFVSPMLRTQQSAQILFPQKPVTIVNEFRETDFGIFEGKTADELKGCSEYQTWLDSFCLAPIPEGEHISDFKKRCCIAFSDIIKKLPEDSSTVFIVHGGVIMAILEAFAEPKQDFYDYHVKNGEFIRCTLQDDNKLKNTAKGKKL